MQKAPTARAPRALLAVTAAEWDGLRGRSQHFMRLAASSGWQVVYLEPPATLLAPFVDRGMAARWRRWRRGLRRLDRNLHLLAPPPILPFGNRSREINRLNQAVIARCLRRALRQLGEPRVDLYAFLPSAVDLMSRLRFSCSIYDCVDDHAAFSGQIDPRVVERMEEELVARADLCFASSRRLFERWRSRARALHLVPNGCELEHFEPASRGSLPTPPDLAAILKPGRPVAGFFGGLGSWIDVELLGELAARRPAIDFVLIGPRRTDLSPLERLANVHLLGSRPYSELPGYLQHFAACLIPFRLERLTASVLPVKLFEYLAAGKPVISTPIEEVLPYRDVVAIAHGARAFAAELDVSVRAGAKLSAAVEARQTVARASSWPSRWQAVLDRIRAAEPREPGP